MKEIKITRNSQFVGSMAKCWIVFNMSEEEARKLICKTKKKLPYPKDLVPIINGQTVSLELNDSKTEFYAACMAGYFSNRVYYSNKVTIAEDCPDKTYVLTLFLNTAYNRSVGNILELTEI